MRVALVTSEGRCGIAEHSLMLRQAVGVADPGIEFVQDPAWLNPGALYGADLTADVLHLNYHRGLHSRWTPAVLASYQGPKIITFHDTYEVQPDRLLHDLVGVSDCVIIHEPIKEWDGTQNGRVRYWRQGVPQRQGYAELYGIKDRFNRPIVGTCGFAFAWKGSELLCDAARLAGWGVLILSHNATDAQVDDWQGRNRWTTVVRQYLTTDALIANLQQCDATAFLYSCANSGTSGAIRLGIAAGKPLLATYGCRQFRDLFELDRTTDVSTDIRWVEPTAASVAKRLTETGGGRFDPGIVALRERDSWEHLGRKYAKLYRELVQP